MTLARTITLAAIFALGTGMSAIAQDSTTTTEAEPEADAAQTEGAEAEEQSGGVGDDLAIGEPADQAGRPFIKETIKDWALRCIQAPTGEERCQMYQLLEDDEGAPVVEFSLFRLPDGGRAEAGATVVVPLETALQQQLTIQVDSSQARRYPFAFCNQIGCYARIGLTSQDVAAFKRGNAAKVTISPFAAPDQKVVLNLSLSGFTNAFSKASVLAQ